jgi:phospholipid transport system substrate-binding protein
MMRVSFRSPLAIAATTLFLLVAAATPRSMAAQDPQQFVGQIGQQAIQSLGPQVAPAQRAAHFRQLFSADFDVPGIGQFVLGRYWRSASPEQQQQFLQLFQEYIARTYSDRLREYGGQPFRVTGSRPNGAEIVVSSEVTRQAGQPVRMDWHLSDHGGNYKVEDVYVDGISMKVTHRDEFAAIIQNNGGHLDAAFAVLRQKLGMTR